MSKLKVKSESFPQRCEICHQSDLFDPSKNHCSRCADLIDKTFLLKQVRAIDRPQRSVGLGGFICAFSGIFIGSLAGTFALQYINIYFNGLFWKPILTFLCMLVGMLVCGYIGLLIGDLPSHLFTWLRQRRYTATR